MRHLVQCKKLETVNTDPQHRCYNGCHFSSKEVLTEWQDVCSYANADDAEDSRLTFQHINKRNQFRVVPRNILNPLS